MFVFFAFFLGVRCEYGMRKHFQNLILLISNESLMVLKMLRGFGCFFGLFLRFCLVW